jgi:FkbM family methyltransferase
MKKIIKNFFDKFGYEIKKLNKNKLNFDDIYQKFFRGDLTIFDVGANKGQSIERFKKIFPNATIHAFEPIEKEFSFLKKTYEDKKDIIINNMALGEKTYEKKLNLSKRTGVSSFNNFNLDHKWIKVRSKQYNTNVEGFLEGDQLVNVVTLDEYCLSHNINKIDILKVDTQGYEDQVLAGSVQTIKNDIIKAIELEIIFDDTYDKYLTFSDLEKYLLPSFRFCGIKNYNQNLFEGINFFAEILYLNKKIITKK